MARDPDSGWASVCRRVRSRVFGGDDADSAAWPASTQVHSDGLVEVLELAPSSGFWDHSSGGLWHGAQDGPVPYGALARWGHGPRRRTGRRARTCGARAAGHPPAGVGRRQVTVVQGGATGYAPTHAFWLPDHLDVDGNGAGGDAQPGITRGPSGPGVPRPGRRRRTAPAGPPAVGTGPGPVSDQLFWGQDGVLFRQGRSGARTGSASAVAGAGRRAQRSWLAEQTRLQFVRFSVVAVAVFFVLCVFFVLGGDGPAVLRLPPDDHDPPPAAMAADSHHWNQWAR